MSLRSTFRRRATMLRSSIVFATMVWDSTCAISISCLAYFSVCTAWRSFPGPVLGLPSSSVLSFGTAGEYGRIRSSVRARSSISRCRRDKQMVWSEPVEILLVEDSRTDAEMTIRALNKHGLGKRLNWVKDGAEALDFLFRQGVYAGRAAGDPKLVFLDLKMPMVRSEGRR